MNVVSYLPSQQFSVTVVSIAAAGGLIIGAQYVTRPAGSAELLAAAPAQPAGDWRESLDEVQATAPSLPPAPDQNAVNKLLEAAKSSNITTSVARSLFINLSAAGAQGMGSDIPTQEKLIADASSQISLNAKTSYAAADLSVAAQTAATMRAWGNGVIKTFNNHPKANAAGALLAVGKATDYADASALAELAAISAAYAALAADLAQVPVPPTMAPLHLQLINDLSRMSDAAAEMKKSLDDPLRGLSGLQTFQTAGTEAARVLTTLAEQLRKGGILFSKDEPGAAWSVFVSP